MIIKTLYLELHLLNSFTLKDKRRVSQSLIKKTHQKFNVSIAEISELDSIDHLSLGFAFVTNSQQFGDKIIDQLLQFIRKNYEVEIIYQEKNTVF